MTSLSRQLRPGIAKLMTLTRPLVELEKAVWLLRKLLAKSVQGERLRGLLDELRKAETLRLKVLELKTLSRYGSLALLAGEGDPAARIPVLNLELQGWLRKINDRLKRYHFTSAVRVIEPTYDGLVKSARSTKRADADQWEAQATVWLVELATNGSGRSPADILKFRNCLLEECGKLFYAITGHQKHCSATCRKKFHSSSPESHKKRSDYMKKYRREEKRLKDEALQRARQSRRKGR